MAKRIYTIRLLIIFATAFLLIFIILNFGVIKANVKFIFSQLGEKFSANRQNGITLPRQSPSQFPVSTQMLSPEPLPNQADIVIDKINIKAPLIMGVPNNNDAIFNALADGVVQHPITPKPGEKGMSILLGHSSNNPLQNSKYGTVFSLLGKLKRGDKFYIEYSNGQRFDYEVRESFVYNPFDPKDTNLYRIEALDYNGVVLTTCWPVGTNLKRQAVLAQEL